MRGGLEIYLTLEQPSAEYIDCYRTRGVALSHLNKYSDGIGYDHGDLWVGLAGVDHKQFRIIAINSPDAVLTPAMAQTPRPLGWFDQEDGERNFEQQVQYTPFTSMLNGSGLPAIVVPVSETADGLPMGVQLIGRPGGEATLLSLARQLERRFRWDRRHPAAWTA